VNEAYKINENVHDARMQKSIFKKYFFVREILFSPFPEQELNVVVFNIQLISHDKYVGTILNGENEENIVSVNPEIHHPLTS
jgi:hypothetical protein